LIEVRDVYFTYPNGVQALRGVSLSVDRGEFVAIMGENGAGKTTLIKHFNGLLKPTRGTVLVDGVDTRKSTVAQLSRKVGIVFQNPENQFFCESVYDEVTFALKNFGFPEDEIEERVTETLRRFGLEKYAKRSPFLLSGGEKKRVAIASVLAWDPEYVVMDEPTVGQDYRSKTELLNLIYTLLDEGRAVVVVTHDVEFVAECEPRVVLISQGRILADGEAHEVFSDFGLLSKASVVPPQSARFTQMVFGQPRALNVEEAVRLLSSMLGVGG